MGKSISREMEVGGVGKEIPLAAIRLEEFGEPTTEVAELAQQGAKHASQRPTRYGQSPLDLENG